MDIKYIKAFKQLIIAALLLLLFAMNTHAQANQTWYQDADDDGLGNPAVSITSATQPVGYVLNKLDCDDNKVTPLTSINVGQPDFTAGLSFYSSIVMDSAGTIYAAYQDGGNGNKASVMKYDGTSWTQVGSAGFTPDTAKAISIALDPSGLPYIAYADYAYGNGGNPARLSVMRFNGTNWVSVGTPGFTPDSTGGGGTTSIVIDQVGTPYVAYNHQGFLVGVPGIWTYNGTSWMRLNTTGLPTNGTSAIQLALDNVGIPWIAYPDWANSGKLSVEKYTGSGWAAVGSAFSNGSGLPIVFKFSNGVPYVFYQDGATGYKANVKKFDGTNWVSIGAADFASPYNNYASMAVDNGGTPWVIINLNNASLALMKFNGTSWVTVSDTLYNSGLGSVYEVDLLIDKSGIPNIVYRTTKLTVKKIAPKLVVSSISISASAINVTGGTSVTYTASAVNGGSSPAYQWYKNGVAIPGANAATYTTTNSNNKDTITCKLVSSDACTVSTPATSTPVIMNVQKYFRTVKGGVYTDITAWQGSPDSITWAAPFGIPDKGVTSIEIRHNITDNRTTNATVPNFTVSSNYIAPRLLSIYGNLVNNGTLYTYDTIAFVNRSTKTISGSRTIVFSNINMTDSSSVNVLHYEAVYGLISFGTNAVLNTGDQVTLQSSATRTAGIGTLPAGADVIGKVWYQRYIPGGSSHRKWRFLAMPIQGQTFANSWQKSIYITGPGLNGRDCGTTGNMIPNSAGFDQNQTGMNHPTDTALTSTIFSWDEQSNAWRGIPSTSAAIDPTTGYRVFVRGDRNAERCALLTVMPDSVSPVTLMGLGEIVKGTITKNLTYTAGKGEGWNLLSNPYPCTVSWNSLFNNNSDLDVTISIMNPINAKYAYYNVLAGVGVNGGSDQIGSGQSFFVQAFNNTIFNFTEQDKSYDPNAGVFGKAVPSLLKIRLTGPDMDDETAIIQSSDATYRFDKNMDGEKRSPDVAISDVVVQVQTEDVGTFIASGTSQANKPLVFNFIPFTQQSDTLPLFVKMNENTSYTFSFPELTIKETYRLWLHDKYTNSYTDIRKQNNTKVNTQSDAASYSDNRFELLIVNSTNVNDSVTTGVNQVVQGSQNRMIVYPVPASEVLNVQLNNASSGTATVGIYDITGKEVLTNTFALGQSNETVALSLNNMAPGAYFIKAVVNGQPLPAQKFIKN